MNDDDLQAVRSAIEAYAEAELCPISYDLADPELDADDRRVLLAEREALYKLQRQATSIAAYANIGSQRGVVRTPGNNDREAAE